jgi:ABC-type bacteriocin/lantibiotic exporter with double-glycine peptidase domain
MQQEADCLAACAAMVLDYIERPMAYSELLRQLGVGEFGVPASRINRLAGRDIAVDYGEGTWEMLEDRIDED